MRVYFSNRNFAYDNVLMGWDRSKQCAMVSNTNSCMDIRVEILIVKTCIHMLYPCFKSIECFQPTCIFILKSMH